MVPSPGNQTLQAWERWRGRAAKAGVLTEAERAVGTKGAWRPPGNLSTLGRVANIAGRVASFGLGLAGVVTGVQSIADPQHEGWVGSGDQVAGGLSVIAGVGTLALAVGLGVSPAGLALIGGAAVLSAGWAIGTFIADEWGDEIRQTAGDVTETVTQTVGDVASFLNPFD